MLLLIATFVLFRPDWFADQIAPEYADAPASKFYEVAANLREGDRLTFLIKGQSLEVAPPEVHEDGPMAGQYYVLR